MTLDGESGPPFSLTTHGSIDYTAKKPYEGILQRKEDNIRSGRRDAGMIPQSLLLAIPVLLAAGILLMFFLGRGGIHSRDLLYEDLDGRIKRIEQRLARMEQKPEEREKELRLAERLERIEKAIARQTSVLGTPSVSRPVPAEKPGKPEPGPRQEDNRTIFHEVAEGETLFKISRTYGVSVDDLRMWNKIPPDEGIRSGQRLRIEKD